MRTALIGAVESSQVALRALVDLGHPPRAVLTLPLASSFRHSDWSDLRPAAARAGVPVHEVTSVNDAHSLALLRQLDLDLLFVVGWSQILQPDLLAAARGGAIGYHPAPLPELRGRAVIPWTILLGRRDTAGTLFWLDQGLDSGAIAAQCHFPVAADETARSLYDRHLAALEDMLTELVPTLAGGEQPRIEQDEGRATWCARRRPEDGWIDWHRPAEEVWTLVRASGHPYPGAFTVRQGEKLVVWEAELVGTAPFYGIPGQVQHLVDGAPLVRCGDGGHLLLAAVEPAAAFRVHERLGPRPGLL